jgi:hypothetical protein
VSINIEPRKLEQLEGQFRAFLQATSLSEYEDRKDHLLIGRSYGHNNAFLTWSHQPYQDVIDAIKQLGLKVSDKTIGKALSDSMVRLFEDQAVREDADSEVEAHLDSILPILDSLAVRAKLKELVDRLSSLVKTHTVFIPVDGVELKGLGRLPIGEVTLFPSDCGPVADVLLPQELHTAARDSIEKAMKAVKCYAMVEVEGESGFAIEQAGEQVQEVVDTLNVFLASSHSRFRGWKKIIPTSYLADSGEFYVYADSATEQLEADSTKWGLTERMPHVHNYEIDRMRVEKWNEWGLRKVVQCFSAEYCRGELESKIRQAVGWYSRGMNADSTSERFVAVTIALESLLVGKGEGGSDPKASWGSLGQRLADRIAFLIGHNFEERIYFATETKRLYGLRSKIVHEGTTVSHENLYQLERVFDAGFWAFVRNSCATRARIACGLRI